MLYAVFPGGGRVRPRLGLGILEALGLSSDDAAMGGAVAVELIHCASLVHDDMPCFDDAGTRRGKPSVHRAFGEDTALLVGDALIVAAFGVLAKYCAHRPDILGPMVAILAESVGASEGIIAGQASEADPRVDLPEVHRKKTGALFEAVAAMAALAAGADTATWRGIGRKLGAAYQIADDILDAVGDTAYAGKPVEQDSRHARPNAVNRDNLLAAVTRLDDTIESAVVSIPPCPGRGVLVALLIGVAMRLCPPTMIPRRSGLMMSAAALDPEGDGAHLEEAG
jgi:geranylgeranyl diphosphate synthase type II